MNRVPDIVAFPMSDMDHNQQICVGLEQLAAANEIRLRYRYDGVREYGVQAKSEYAAVLHVVVARVAGLGDIVFDTHDGPGVQPQYHDRCVAYFKRSYDPIAHGGMPRVHPLGFNYEVRADRPSAPALIRALKLPWSTKSKLRGTLRALHLPGPHVCSASELVADRTGPSKNPRILFVARTWEPLGFVGISTAEVQRRTEINEMRADCVRGLRKAFGDHFTGGLIRTGHALQHFADAIVPVGFATDRKSFLRLVATHDICISTAGLLDSIGWKMAEYVMNGRAVVAERMVYRVPPPFAEGSHYLKFLSADQCVAQCARLIGDTALRGAMMQANQQYFRDYAVPASLVRNAITRAEQPFVEVAGITA